MVVEVTRRDSISNKVFELRNGSALGDVYEDYVKALKLYPIDMETVRDAVLPIVTYTIFLSFEVFLGLYLGLLINKEKVMLKVIVGMSFGAFCAMLLFFFIAGYIYRSMLAKRLDTSYISYVYVVAFSMTYYPLLMFISLISGYNIGFLFMIVAASISQFFIDASMLRGHSFESNRERFIFGIVTFILQWGFIICSFGLFSIFSPSK